MVEILSNLVDQFLQNTFYQYSNLNQKFLAYSIHSEQVHDLLYF